MKTETCSPNSQCTLNDIQIADVVWIQTRNSLYRFLVIDPLKSYGILVGGTAGPRAIDAFLYNLSTLTTGMKARLLISTRKGIRCITTSTIKAIAHVKSN